MTRRSRFRLSFLSAGIIGAMHCAAWAVPLDFNTFTAENYSAASSFSTPNWVVLDGGHAVTETGNSTGAIYYSQQNILNKRIRGIMLPGSDDDMVGIALGFNPGDTTNSNAKFLLIDWKGVTQTFNYGGGIHAATPGTTANIGLALSQVQGVPTNDELFGHVDLPENANGGVTELARGITRGASDYVSGRGTTGALFPGMEFEIIYEPSRVQVFVNRVLQMDVAGDFGDGRLAMYELSQSPGAAFGDFHISDINDLSDSTQRHTAGLIQVAPGSTTNANSVWTVVATGVGAHHMSVITGPNFADTEIAFDGRAPRATDGILMLTVAENGPRDGGAAFGTATSSFVHSGWGQNRYGISTFATNAQNAEGNIDVAAAFFPFDQGWIGAHVTVPSGTGTNNHSVVASNGVTLGDITQIATPSAVDQNGLYNIVIPGVDSTTDGLLFAVAATGGNDGTYAAATRNGTGGWRIGVRDHAAANNSTADNFEHDLFSFLYIPIDTEKLVAGHVTGFEPDGSVNTDLSAGRYTMTRLGTGEYLLTMTDHSATEGVLMLTASTTHILANGQIAPLNQYLTYETVGDSYLINLLTLNLGVVTPSDGQFSFAFIPFVAEIPEPATGLLALGGLALLSLRRRRTA